MNEIFSEKVVTSRRTYFFDVKETKEGAKYLVIGELTQIGNDTERHRVMVFEESLDSFVDGLEKAVEFVKYAERGDDRRDEWSGSRERNAGGGTDLRRMLERIERSVNEIRDHFR
jgi:hypothetical protein